MYDLSQPNAKPGICVKCRGTGTYSWGACVNGKMSNSGPCYSCQGTGRQDGRQIRRNKSYNHFKLRDIAGAMRNENERARDRDAETHSDYADNAWTEIERERDAY